ncbi:hypothetical protein VPH35_048019 [Triticum aestivum]
MARSPLLAAAVALVVVAGAYAASEQDELKLRPPPVAPFDFYKRSCPKAEFIVRDFVQDAVRKDVGLAVGLLRLRFHDCFVQGCDTSLLLAPGEQQAPPNLSLRPSAFKAINDIRDHLERECHGAIVSCSDILALAARDSVVATGGPDYRVPLGRRDSPWFATRDQVIEFLPRPSSNGTTFLNVLHKLSHNLDATDLVALSGRHTIGVCTSFEKRLYPRPDPTMNPSLVASLKQTCPAEGTVARTALDVGTPKVRQPVLRQPGETGGALRVRQGPLHQHHHPAHRRALGTQPV